MCLLATNHSRLQDIRHPCTTPSHTPVHAHARACPHSPSACSSIDPHILILTSIRACAQGSVVSIVLRDNGLAGTIPPDLTALASLQVIPPPPPPPPTH